MIAHAQNSALADNVGSERFEIESNVTHVGMLRVYQMSCGTMKAESIVLLQYYYYYYY